MEEAVSAAPKKHPLKKDGTIVAIAADPARNREPRSVVTTVSRDRGVNVLSCEGVSEVRAIFILAKQH